eukprot:5766034-Amphidinium_carterae.1
MTPPFCCPSAQAPNEHCWTHEPARSAKGYPEERISRDDSCQTRPGFGQTTRGACEAPIVLEDQLINRSGFLLAVRGLV